MLVARTIAEARAFCAARGGIASGGAGGIDAGSSGPGDGESAAGDAVSGNALGVAPSVAPSDDAPNDGMPGDIALVPTMGALHAGHETLIAAARATGARVAVSLFVNRAQFDRRDDYANYPRAPARDLELLRAAGVALAFAPDEDEMRVGAGARVAPGPGADALCGRDRPGHFCGVLTVVAQLFNIFRPRFAFFGEKDRQQLVLIGRMIEDLHFPIELRAAPTARASDGLAHSSRNARLAPDERRRAPLLYRSLRAAADAIAGGRRDFGALEAGARRRLEEGGFRVDYVEVRHARTLAAPQAAPRAAAEGAANLAVFGAAWLGAARLIDNVPVAPC